MGYPCLLSTFDNNNDVSYYIITGFIFSGVKPKSVVRLNFSHF